MPHETVGKSVIHVLVYTNTILIVVCGGYPAFLVIFHRQQDSAPRDVPCVRSHRVSRNYPFEFRGHYASLLKT